MIFFYKTIGNKPINIITGEIVYVIYPGERVTCEDSNDLGCVEIKKQRKFRAINYLGLMAKRLGINILNMIIMNYPPKWFTEIDPLVFHAVVSVETSEMEIEYRPMRFYSDGLIKEKPALFINGQKVNASFEIDCEHITVSFWKYCFDLISFWMYAALIITMALALSGMFEKYLLFNSIYLLITAFLVYKKIRKTHIEKQRLLVLLLAQEWIKNG